MRFLNNFVRQALFLAIFSIFAAVLVQTKTVYSNEQTILLSNSAVESETKASELSKLWDGELLRRSISLYLEAANQWSQISEWQKTSNCLREAARLYLLLGDYKSAFVQLNKALKIDHENNYVIGKAATLSLLSTVSLQSGDLQKSKKYFNQALAFSKQSEDLTAQAMALYSAAEFYYNQSDSDKPISFYEQSLNLWRKAEDGRGEIQTLISLAYAYANNGNPIEGLNKSIEAQKRALEVGDKRGQAVAQIMIGHMNLVMDEKQAALNIYQSAGEIFPGNMDFLENARLQNAIGSIYEDYGQWQLSLNYRRKAFELFQREQYLYGQLATLPSLGRLSYLSGDEASALKHFEEAVGLAGKLNDEFYLAFVWKELGDFYKNKNFPKEAVEYYKKSLPILQKLNSKRYVAYIQNNLAMIYEKQGDLALAKQFYDSALKISREIKNKFAEVETLYYLSRVSDFENNHEKALDFAKNSVEQAENLYLDINNSKLKSSYLSSVFDHYKFYIHLLMKSHKQSSSEGYELQALQAAEKSRARSMLENLSLAEDNFTKDADVTTIRREKEIRIFLNTKADKLIDLLSNNADKSEIDRISREINELEHELEEIKAKLKQLSPLYYAIKNPAPFDVSEFQSKILDENSLLLEFSFGEKESYLWVISKTEVSSYVLPAREQIETKIQKLREFLAARQLTKGEEIEAYQERILKAENDYWLAAKQLSDELFGQVADKFEKKRLIIVPDGKLYYFPVSALPLPNSDTGDPILLSNEVIYEPSASTLSIISKSQNQTSGAAKNLLVFSDPVFTKDDSRILATQTSGNLNPETTSPESFRFVESLNSLSRLLASKTEADSIIEIFGQSYTDSYSGFAASREQLLNAKTADYRILHFATHGLIDEARPELSGIVLSRFAENGQKLDEFVRLHDIYGMNLNSDLVVLSACETGIGKEVRGEGLMSLNNAFLQVGAKSVMSSLWKVEDNATLELMKNFYQSLANENTTPSKALQKAQIKMWESGRYKSPFYWAAFTVQGDFRRAPEFSRDFPYAFVFSAASLGGLLFGIFWLYGRKRGNRGLLNRK